MLFSPRNEAVTVKRRDCDVTRQSDESDDAEDDIKDHYLDFRGSISSFTSLENLVANNNNKRQRSRTIQDQISVTFVKGTKLYRALA